jgi:squalene-hopene/tetraprenyl-beta-curcumene cyclase
MTASVQIAMLFLSLEPPLPQAAPPAPGPASAAEVLAPPTEPLDPRIDREKVTRLEPPPMPAFIAPPLPPLRRIAADAAEVPISPDLFGKAHAAMVRGLEALAARQASDGSWMRRVAVTPTDASPREGAASVAVTALAAKAFLQAGPLPRFDGTLSRAMRFVTAAIEGGGGFDGLAAGGLGNYVASAVVMALASAEDPAFADHLQQGVAWLRLQQWDQGEGLSPQDDWFGGAGYGRGGRPDLSNTQLFLDALQDAGVSPDDPAIQRALVFVTRTQNLPATNPAGWAQAGSGDGGFVYSPANGGESFASEAAGEGRHGERLPEGAARSLRSYGSMTYAGFKSLLYAGLTRDDPRVRAAFDWIRRNWTFDENPGLGQQGLFYYYHAMARALLASQQAVIETAEGLPRRWRDEIVEAILARQRPDGTWVNAADRWEEGQPDLVTAYAVLALQEALKPVASVAD